jgi:hypothetical protein
MTTAGGGVVTPVRSRLVAARDLVATPALVVSFGLLLLVGVAGESAAKPGLGPRGWAPGDLAWSPSPALVTGLLWAAYLLGAVAVWLRLKGEPSVVSGAGMLGAVAARARRRLATHDG